MADLAPELTTVSYDTVVVHHGTTVHRATGLASDTEHTVGGLTARTLPRPPGELLSVFATVNDTHFGEAEVKTDMGGVELGPRMRRAEHEEPHPVLCNRTAIAEIAAIAPDAVLAKGDLTTHGTREEHQQFLDHYVGAFGDRMHHVRGNHDQMGSIDLSHEAPFAIHLAGVTLAVLDTTERGRDGGRLTTDQVEWLDALAADADRPVLAFGHHHVWNPDASHRSTSYFGIDPDSSDALIAVFQRRDTLRGYFAGHTHRNRVRRFPWLTGDRPFAEISCVKDYPGVWAEYRVHEGGIVQVVHRISDPETLAWTDRTRDLLPDGAYVTYAAGTLADRCFTISV